MNSQFTIDAICQDLSLYIPYVTLEFSKEYITGVFEAAGFGIVSRVDLVRKTDSFGNEYNIAYVHFAEWFDNDYTRRCQVSILSFHGTKIAINDAPFVWSVRENKAVRRVSGQRKLRLNLSDIPAPEPLEPTRTMTTTYREPEEKPVVAREPSRYMQENAELRAENDRLRATLDEMGKKSVHAAHSRLLEHKRLTDCHRDSRQTVHKRQRDTDTEEEIRALKERVDALENENAILREAPKATDEWCLEAIDAVIERENLIDQFVSVIENSPTFTEAKNNVQVLYKDSPYYPIGSYLTKPAEEEEPEAEEEEPTFEEWQENYKEWQKETAWKR
jgi:regulator of replication initiation timing